jgi:chromosome segregation ATPase
MTKNTGERRDNTVLNYLIQIKEELATNTTETRNLRERLDKMNGSIYNHNTAIESLKQNVATNTRSIDELKHRENIRDEKEEQQHERRDDTWRRYGDKILWGIVVGAGIIIWRLLILLESSGHLKDLIK